MARAFCWGLLAALAAAPASADDSKLTIHYGFPPGVYLMTAASQTEGVTEVSGQKHENRADERLVWRVTAAKPEGQEEKKLTLRLTEVAMDGVSNGGQAVHFDSAGRGAPKGGYDFVYPPLMNTDVLVTLDADDTVVDVAGLDKLWASLEGKARTLEQKSALSQTRFALGDKSVETGLRRLEALMPKGPIGVGDAWKAGVRLEMPTIGELKARYDCKLVSVEKGAGGDLAVIEANGVYNLSQEKTVEVEGGGKLTVRVLDLQEKATIKVNLATGALVSDDSTRSVTLQGAAIAGGQQRDLTLRSTARETTSFVTVSSAAPAPVAPTPAPADHAAPHPAQPAPNMPGGPGPAPGLGPAGAFPARSGRVADDGDAERQRDLRAVGGRG